MAGLLDADVDVEHGETVAGEPAWLDGDGAAVDWPFCAVRRLGHATTWKPRVSMMFVPRRWLLRKLRLQGYIHCCPHGKVAVPLSS